MRRTVTIRELLELYDRRDSIGHSQEIETRQTLFASAQATGRMVLLDRVMPHDPDGALFMGLIGSSCGHLIRLPITRTDLAALIAYARSEGIIV